MNSPLSRLLSAAVLCHATVHVHASPAGSIPLETALDTTGITWQTGGASPWIGQAALSQDGVDAARSGGGFGASWLETTVNGPGVLRCAVRVAVEPATVSLNGAVHSLTPRTNWTVCEFRLAPGPQSIRFAAGQESVTAEGPDALVVDTVSVVPRSAVSLGEAADAPGLTWQGTAGAFGLTEPGATGDDVLVVRETAMAPGEVSVALTGPAALRFRWRMPARESGAVLTVAAAGRTETFAQPADSPEATQDSEDWQESEVLVPPGPQTVRWQPAAGGDFLLDAVTVTLAPPLGDAVGQPGLTWNGDWLVRPSPDAAGGALAVTRVLSGNAESALTASVTGPAEIMFRSCVLAQNSGGEFVPRQAVTVQVGGAAGAARTMQTADGWFLTTLLVPEGAHAVRWVVQTRQTEWYESPEVFKGLLADVQITPFSPTGLAAALDTTLTPQLTEGAALSGRWRGFSEISQGIRGNSLVCGPLEAEETTALSLPVSGPSRVVFSLRGERWDNERQVTFAALLDGAPVLDTAAVDRASADGSQENPWRTLAVEVPAGAHTLTLRGTGQGGGALLWLDALTYLPEDPGIKKLGGAVDFRGAVWQRVSPPGAGGWRMLGTPLAREGEALAACMDVRTGQAASMEAAFTGPGTLSFTWGLSAAGSFKLYVDGEEALNASQPPAGVAARNWRAMLRIGAGTHRLRWKFVRNGTAEEESAAGPGLVQAWLDAVGFVPAPAGSDPAAGLDVTSAVTVSNTWPWRTVALAQAPSGDGDAAVVEVPVAGNASLELPVNGPGRYAFWWRREHGGEFDFPMFFSVDGSLGQYIQASDDWFRAEVAVGPGSHVLRWEAEAPTVPDPDNLSGNRLWLDGFTALPVLPLAEALDNSLTWSTGAPSSEDDPTGWTGLTALESATNPGSDDAAVTDGTRPLTTQVSGPGIVTFRWAEKQVPASQRLTLYEAPAAGSPVAAGFGLGSGSFSLSFSLWNISPPPQVRGAFTVDGRTAATLTTRNYGETTDFITHSIHVGPGSHTLVWQRPLITPGWRLVLESVSFAPSPDTVTPVATELGLTPAQFFMPTTPWTVQSADTHDGAAALQSPALSGETSTLELPVTGPGRLSFWWKGTGYSDFRDTMHDVIENSGIIVIGPPLRWYAPAEWTQFTLEVPAGPRTYIWRAPAGGMLWLDEFHFASPQPLTGPNAVNEALDFAGLTWNAPGWEPLTGGLGDTGDALRGPALGGVQVPWLETQITGPATLAFTAWAGNFSGGSSSGNNTQAVSVRIDSVETTTAQGVAAQRFVAIPAGLHTLRLEFPGSSAAGQQPVLDDVRLEVPIATALGMAGSNWTSGGPAVPWRGWQSAAFPGRSDWVESPAVNGTPQESQLNTVITGPVVLAFDAFIQQTQWWSVGGPHTLVLRAGGAELWRAPVNQTGWQRLQVSLPPGTHNVSWSAGTGILARLDNVTITPDGAPGIDFAAALEAPGYEFTAANFTDPPEFWTPVRPAGDASHDDAVRAVYRSEGPPRFFTTVEGPAWVSFDYRGQGLALLFRVDGATVQTLQPPFLYEGYPLPAPIWQTMRRLFVPEGVHTLAWETGARQPAASVAWVEVDALKIEPLFSAPGTVPLAEALDWPGLEATSGPAGPWLGRNVTGGDVVVAIAHTDPLSLQATVDGPGTLVFRWRRESLGNGTPAFFNFKVDGAFARSYADENSAWVTEHWPLPAGTHTLEWQALAHYAGQSPSLVWVDDLRLLPAPTLAAAMESPPEVALAVVSGEPAPFTRPDGTDALFLSALAAPSAVSATVNGPGELSFDWLPWALDSTGPPPLLLDGQPVGSTVMDNFTHGFFRVAIAVGPGTHVLTWQSSRGIADAAGVTVDAVSWSSGFPAWAAAAGGLGGNGVTAWLRSGKTAWTAAAGAFAGSAAATTEDGWIQAVVPPGPGTLCWWARTPGTYSGILLHGPSGPGWWSPDWRLVSEGRSAAQPLPAWQLKGGMQLTGVSFAPAAPVPLAQALDAPGLTFTSAPDAPLTGVTAGDAVMGNAAAKTTFTRTEGSWVETALTGPGRLAFSWRRVSRSGTGTAALAIEGIGERPLTSAAAGWKTETVWLETGTRTVRWRFSPDCTGDEFWLDAVQFTPSTAVPLAAALEYSGAAWTSGGAAPWTGRLPLPDTTGGDAALSPALEAGGEAWLETTLPGSGVLTWRWREMVPDQGKFDVLLNGLPLASYSSHTWRAERWELPAGPHTLRWRYVAGAAGEGQAMLDDVTFTPGPPPAWDSALGVPGVKAGGGGSAPWTLVPDAGGDFLRTAGDVADFYDSGTLFADVTGPAFVSAQVRPESAYYFSTSDTWQYRGGGGEWGDLPAHYIPAGTQRLRWRAFSIYHLDVRKLQITPLQPVPLAEAVEAQGFSVFNDAANSWAGLRDPADPNGDDFAAAVVPGGTARSLEAEFTGPGVLRVTWAWSEILGGTSPLLWLMEGETVLRSDYLSGNYIDNRFGYEKVFGPGLHRVKLVVDLRDQLSATFAPRLENLQFEPWPVTDIATAFDAPGRSFTTGGGSWVAGVVQPELAAAGTSTVRMQSGSGNPPWLETQVTGPAQVSFRYRLSAAAGSGLLVSVNGFQQRYLNIGAGQEASGTGSVRLPAGTHTLRWQWQGSPASDGALNAALLDSFVLTPSTVVSLPEAADSPALTFTPQAGTWTGLTGSEAVSGGDFIEATSAGQQPVSFTLSLTGPGLLRWAWRNSDRGYGPVLSAQLQGRVWAEAGPYMSDWQQGFLAVPPGAQTITFSAIGDSVTESKAWFDAFSWRPTSAGVTLASALEATGLNGLTVLQPGDWFPIDDPQFPFGGGDVLVAGVPGRTHSLRAQATGPGTLAFTTSRAASPLTVHNGGSRSTLPVTSPGDRADGYREMHFTGLTGSQTFDIIHPWQAFYRSQYDYTWLDSLTFTPAQPEVLAVAVDQPRWTFRTGGPIPWTGATTPAGTNGSLAFSTLAFATPAAAQSWIETDLTGPGMLFAKFATAGTGRVYVDGVLQSNGLPLFVAAGPHTVRWGIQQNTPAVDLTATLDQIEWQPGTWPLWQAHHFPAGTPESAMALDADPDGDRVPNGVEAFLGTSPLQRNSAPVLEVIPRPSDTPRIVFPAVRNPPEGLHFAVEVAPSPAGPWATQTAFTASGGWTDISYVLSDSTPSLENRYFFGSAAGAQFYRMKVTVVP